MTKSMSYKAVALFALLALSACAQLTQITSYTAPCGCESVTVSSAAGVKKVCLDFGDDGEEPPIVVDPTCVKGFVVERTATANTGMAGQILYARVGYQPEDGKLSLIVTMSNQSPGYWIVLTDGGVPFNVANKYAILYVDNVERFVTAYVYDGDNGAASSGLPENFIGRLNPARYDIFFNEDDSTTSTIVLDVGEQVNGITPPPSDEWVGMVLGELAGVWLHPFEFPVRYVENAPNLMIDARWSPGSQTFWDTFDITTQVHNCTEPQEQPLIEPPLTVPCTV